MNFSGGSTPGVVVVGCGARTGAPDSFGCAGPGMGFKGCMEGMVAASTGEAGWGTGRRVGDVWRCGGRASNSTGGFAGEVGEWVGAWIGFGEKTIAINGVISEILNRFI